MLYKLYQLKFTTPVHFGSDKMGTSLEKVNLTCHSDTLFSAICNEFLKIYDELALDDYVDLFDEGKILISSLYPFKGEDLFLPKPSLIIERANSKELEYSNKKKMKKLEFLKVLDFKRYLECLKSGEPFTYDEADYTFAQYSDSAKVCLRTDDDKNKIYHVGSYTFERDAGLYFVARFKDEKYVEQFEKILYSLQYTGIGGKRSSGYGKFEIEDPIELSDNLLESEEALLKLLQTDGNYRMLLSLASPDEVELDLDYSDSFYNLIKRDGFVYSVDYADTLVKRKHLIMFKEGSCLAVDIQGTIQDVSDNGNHPVYRYGKALSIGVEV